MSGDAVSVGLADAAGDGGALVGGALDGEELGGEVIGDSLGDGVIGDAAGEGVSGAALGAALDGEGLGDGDVVATSAATPDSGVGEVEAATGNAEPYKLTRLNTTTNMRTHAQTRDPGVTRAVSPVALTTA